ncbi:MAG: GNAT family N-acetyltransferase [Dermatophilaceae bacterium]|nr:GNAT family N-acetyltransferase [Actinomycetales bacterium]MBP9919412.1 GNAT family N-acetyltransferase [Dermatophilaceae bacterium]
MALLSPTLTTARLVLRPFRDADRREVFELHSNARVMRYWDSAPWRDETQADRFLARCRALSDNEAGARVAVERRDTGRFIGWIGLQHWDHDNRSANLGYVFAEHAWGQGYATEAGRALLEWGFDVMDLNRVSAQTDTRNEASARVLTKLGFTLEGILRENVIVDGEVSDDATYSLLRREWTSTHSAPSPQ